ncbi:MAG: SCP2 sterol-binding domain-containing protein [Eubacterium sp.]|nr:SCP2 sterol-binding domain-containing protein [Eubacterium sp.]
MTQLRVNIYYGGRGLIDDPTIFVIERITKVLNELEVTVERYNLFEEKSSIMVMPKTLKDVDAVVLAASVEWFGIGGFLQQFLDACWLYGDKEEIKKIYMLPVVMATTYGEREAEFSMIRAWEMLGGIPCEGICAYVENHVDFETNAKYNQMIEKKTENFYRMIASHGVGFPNSNMQVKKTVLRTATMSLTPQESEQLSAYVANDEYVKKQKEDIEELTNLFKGMVGEAPKRDEYIDTIREHFYPMTDEIEVIYRLNLTDEDTSIFIEVNNDFLDVYRAPSDSVSEHGEPDVTAEIRTDVFRDILDGEKTFQGSFMRGDMPSVHGNFTMVRNFDTLFRFNDVEVEDV